MESLIASIAAIVICCLIIAIVYLRLHARIQVLEAFRAGDKDMIDGLKNRLDGADQQMSLMIENAVRAGMVQFDDRLKTTESAVIEIHDMVSSLIGRDERDTTYPASENSEVRSAPGKH